MTTTTNTPAPQTNAAGFVRFDRRNSSWRGDRYTWARYDAETRALTVNLARSGRISPEYLAEFCDFCAAYGIDVDSLRHGEPVTITLPAEPAEAEAENTEAAAPANDTPGTCPVCGHPLTVSDLQYEDGEYISWCEACEALREAARRASATAVA